MPTNLAIDDKLIVEAQRVGGHKSKRDAVNHALAEYIRRRKQQNILGLFGKLDWDKDYNYKSARKRT